jgi:hypothetical protein
MRLANLITNMLNSKLLVSSTIFTLFFFTAAAQENSPYTRFGIGDVQNNYNVANKGMGGISQGFTESNSFLQPLNLANPASMATIYNAQFDLAADITSRSLKGNPNAANFKATNTILSYLQVGLPLTPNKWYAKQKRLALAFGLKPLTKINYKVRVDERIPGIDSAATLFEGNGGVNQANITLAYKVKSFSVGITSGYNFGNRTTSAERVILNDSIGGYYKRSNSTNSTQFGAVFLNLGAQYDVKLKNMSSLTFGATVNLQNKLKAKRTALVETVDVGFDGTLINVDTVSFEGERKGNIIMPMNIAFGAAYADKHWIMGADVEIANWANYSSYGVKEPTQNTFRVKVGAQYFPATEKTSLKKKLAFLRYRAGAYYGTDYISKRREYGFTLGAGMQLTSNYFSSRFGEFVMLNTAVDLGQRNSSVTNTIKEGIFRVNIGLSIAGSWFRKRKYD